MKKIIAANWKLFKTPAETRTYFQDFLTKVSVRDDRQLVFFPPATSLESASQSIKSTFLKWGAQNCCVELQGAFTGEISARVVKELGGDFILLGHSERRALFGETSSLISQKVKAVQALGLTTMLCIGETLEQRKSGQTDSVLKSQLQESLGNADRSKPLVVAYEPVWSIGTGVVASLEQIEQAHQSVEKFLKDLDFKQEIPILYGGSVKPENVGDISRVPRVSGFLVGGASLEVDSFKKICEV
jgi:triosephosphate isomerase